MSLHLFFSNTIWLTFIIFCFIAMDDVELPSDDESANGQSEEEYDINSGEDNNSASLDMGKVISFLDFLLFM